MLKLFWSTIMYWALKSVINGDVGSVGSDRKVGSNPIQFVVCSVAGGSASVMANMVWKTPFVSRPGWMTYRTGRFAALPVRPTAMLVMNCGPTPVGGELFGVAGTVMLTPWANR